MAGGHGCIAIAVMNQARPAGMNSHRTRTFAPCAAYSAFAQPVKRFLFLTDGVINCMIIFAEIQ